MDNSKFRQLDDLELYLDPGFVHHRKIEAILGQSGMSIIDNEINKLPLSLMDWEKRVRIDHIYSRILLLYCKQVGIRSLDDCVTSKNGYLACSIEEFLPTDTVYESRVRSELKLKSGILETVFLEYSTNKIYSDTLKSGLSNGGEFGFVAEYNRMKDGEIYFHPLLIGYPYLISKTTRELNWGSYTDYYNVKIDDFAEFEKVKDIPLPDSCEDMRMITENAFKKCLSKLLGDSLQKDWGGETSDYFSSHLHIGNATLTGVFLLKGPANFRPMTLNHLGKNNDQIVRLSKEPVDVLFVQHCHDITTPVRETLKVFATQPSNPKRYCFIDGRDSLRLLKAYNLFDEAIELSK